MVWVWPKLTPPRLAVMTAWDNCVTLLDDVRVVCPLLVPAGIMMLPPGTTLLAEEVRLTVVVVEAAADSVMVKPTEAPAVTVFVEAVNAVMVGVVPPESGT
jgi:hypothetical protein